MKKITIMTPCYNEEENVELVYEKVKAQFKELPQYQYEHLFIDNCSTDKTVECLEKLAKKDKNVKVIVNARNFGHIRSPSYAMYVAECDALISIVADLQDPPEMIKDFLAEWEKGYKIVAGVKADSKESKLLFLIRKAYYRLVHKIADVDVVQNFTGFGLFDKQILDLLKSIKDPTPYVRGLISEIGFKVKKLPYVQPVRTRGITKHNFYSLYDFAMLGITNHSKVPLRIATIGGFFLSGMSLLAAFVYLIIKLCFWNSLPTGYAPIMISMFFFFSVQLFFIGLLGEYILAIHIRSLNRPMVVEERRINF